MTELSHEQKLALSRIVDQKLGEAIVEMQKLAPGLSGESVVLCVLASAVRMLRAAGAPLQLLENETKAIFLHFRSEEEKVKP